MTDDDLIRAAIEAGRVTKCPPAYVAPVTGATKLGPVPVAEEPTYRAKHNAAAKAGMAAHRRPAVASRYRRARMRLDAMIVEAIAELGECTTAELKVRVNASSTGIIEGLRRLRKAGAVEFHADGKRCWWTSSAQ